MNKAPLELLSDFVTEAHTKIQQDIATLNPVVSVSQKMRTIGMAVDVMTIDCLQSGKRILIVLKDAEPGLLSYQFCMKDNDPCEKFETLALSSLTMELLYGWMSNYLPAQ